MNIDRKSDFGALEPLMLEISEHIRNDPDPKSNGSRYNIVWSKIFAFTQGAKNSEQANQSDHIPDVEKKV